MFEYNCSRSSWNLKHMFWVLTCLESSHKAKISNTVSTYFTSGIVTKTLEFRLLDRSFLQHFSFCLLASVQKIFNRQVLRSTIISHDKLDLVSIAIWIKKNCLNYVTSVITLIKKVDLNYDNTIKYGFDFVSKRGVIYNNSERKMSNKLQDRIVFLSSMLVSIMCEQSHSFNSIRQNDPYVTDFSIL